MHPNVLLNIIQAMVSLHLFMRKLIKILDSEMVLWEDIDVFIQPLMVVNYSRSIRKVIHIVLLEVVLR